MTTCDSSPPAAPAGHSSTLPAPAPVAQQKANDFLFEKFSNLLKYVDDHPELAKIDLAPALGSLARAGKVMTFADLRERARGATPEQVRGSIERLFVQGDPCTIITEAHLAPEHTAKLLRYVEMFRDVCAQ